MFTTFFVVPASSTGALGLTSYGLTPCPQAYLTSRSEPVPSTAINELLTALLVFKRLVQCLLNKLCKRHEHTFMPNSSQHFELVMCCFINTDIDVVRLFHVYNRTFCTQNSQESMCLVEPHSNTLGTLFDSCCHLLYTYYCPVTYLSGSEKASHISVSCLLLERIPEIATTAANYVDGV